jgi:hypothetical protein
VRGSRGPPLMLAEGILGGSGFDFAEEIYDEIVISFRDRTEGECRVRLEGYCFLFFAL